MGSATWDEVRARRLAPSSLAERVGAYRLVDVAHDLGGVHRFRLPRELQLGVRVAGITQSDIREALWERRSLVKAWTVRGTLHLHPAGELALWHAARRAVTGAPAGVLHPPLGRDDVKASRAAVWDALDGRCMLREELAEEVVKRVGPAPRQRLLSGFAFFLDESWQEVEERDALLEVCRRYLHTYSPARPEGRWPERGRAPPSKATPRKTGATGFSLISQTTAVDLTASVPGSRARVSFALSQQVREGGQRWLTRCDASSTTT